MTKLRLRQRKQVVHCHAGGCGKIVVFPVPSSEVAGLSLLDPWIWKRDC
jgi:hypothetical protein